MKRLSVLVGLALPGLLHAQPLPHGLSVDRDHVRIRQPVQVVVNFGAATRWCGLRVDLGDGDVREILVDDFPVILIKQYAAEGRYVVRAEGRFMARGIQSAPGCVGGPRTLTVVVGDGVREQRGTDTTRETQGRDADLAPERRRREPEERREAPIRDRGVATASAPVPAANPPRTPAAAASKPRDGTLKAF